MAKVQLATLDLFEKTYEMRIVPIDERVAAEWARLLGAKEKHLRDKALAATARVHGMVLVTRNVKDVRGCDVLVLDPFRSHPVIVAV